MEQELGSPVKVGVLGTGYMGNNHARILSSLPGAELVGVFDGDSRRCEECASEHGARAFHQPSSLYGEVEAVVIAVPTDLHYSFAAEALRRGLDVLVEKPITDTVEHARELCGIAEESGKVLQVGHVERFNPVCLELPRLVNEPIYFSCERLSPYLASWVGNTGVILDLMIHDLDIVMSLVGEDVVEVNAVSASLKSDTEDLALAQLVFQGGTIANLISSRVSQAKVRKISVTQGEEYIAADLLRQSIAIHHFVSSDYFFDKRMGFKQETVTEIPYLSRYGEPLRMELESFIESVRTRSMPLVSGADATAALALALRVMEECGAS